MATAYHVNEAGECERIPSPTTEQREDDWIERTAYQIMKLADLHATAHLPNCICVQNEVRQALHQARRGVASNREKE